jgi:hypothetical protein
MKAAVLLVCALCLCSGYDLNSIADDGAIGLPPSDDDDVKPMDSTLKADKSFMAAQESLKQAQALPDVQTDDLGLGEARQAAEAEAFNQEAGQESRADSMLLGESYSKQRRDNRKGHVDALMGKLIMSDMFSEKEVGEIKHALLHASSAHDLGEGKGVPAHKDEVALAKGLKVALAKKTQAEDQVKKMSHQMEQSKAQQASMIQATATNLAQCKKDSAAAHAGSSKMITALRASKLHSDTVAHVAMRGLDLCNKRAAAAEGQVNSLKGTMNTAAAKAATKAVEVQATSSTMSPCCQACSKLSTSQSKLLGADCSGCPAEVEAKMSAPRQAPKLTAVGTSKSGGSECCQACSQLSKTEIGLLKADCSGC